MLVKRVQMFYLAVALGVHANYSMSPYMLTQSTKPEAHD